MKMLIKGIVLILCLSSSALIAAPRTAKCPCNRPSVAPAAVVPAVQPAGSNQQSQSGNTQSTAQSRSLEQPRRK